MKTEYKEIMLLKSISDFENETKILFSILETSPREPQYFYYDGKYINALVFICIN